LRFLDIFLTSLFLLLRTMWKYCAQCGPCQRNCTSSSVVGPHTSDGDLQTLLQLPAQTSNVKVPDSHAACFTAFKYSHKHDLLYARACQMIFFIFYSSSSLDENETCCFGCCYFASSGNFNHPMDFNHLIKSEMDWRAVQGVPCLRPMSAGIGSSVPRP